MRREIDSMEDLALVVHARGGGTVQGDREGPEALWDLT
jgi:hypothetical protein